MVFYESEVVGVGGLQGVVVASAGFAEWRGASEGEVQIRDYLGVKGVY